MIKFVLLGFITCIFQLILLREFTFSIAKNELSFVFGIGIWLIACSLGSLVSFKKKAISSFFLIALFSLFFGLSISATHLIKSLFGLNYYEATSFGFTLISSILIIGPLSFLMGYGFGFFNNRYLENHKTNTQTFAQFFAYEAIGIFIGGLAFTFFFANYTNPFYFILLPALFILISKKKILKKIFLFAWIFLLSSVFTINFNNILKKEFKNSKILFNIGSQDGPIILTKKSDVQSLFVNGSLIATSEDRESNEYFIHETLFAKKQIKDVLWIGPYFSGQVNEILKHSIETLDFVNINPVLSHLSQSRIQNSQKVDIHFFIDDPRAYIKNVQKEYDCIILNIPPPSSLALNRYFTLEFFQLVSNRLNQDGLLSFSIPSKRDILSPSILRFNSCILNTLDKIFAYKLLIPSDIMTILATKDKMISSAEIIKNFESSDLKTQFVTVYHLKDVLDPERQRYTKNMINSTISINKDFTPYGFLYYLFLAQARFHPNFSIRIPIAQKIIPIFFVMFVIASSFISLLRKSAAVTLHAATLGFISIGSSTIIYLLFQIFSSSLFWKIGFLVGIFMLGLASATLAANFLLHKVSVSYKTLTQVYLAWIIFILSFSIAAKLKVSILSMETTFYIFSFIAGGLTGIGYPVLTNLFKKDSINSQNITVSIYAYDLLGAFLGTICFSLILIPFLGINLGFMALLIVVISFGLKSFWH